MVEHMDFNGNDQYGCDTCGRLFWRLADCPRVSSYKTGIIFGFRERVYVNQCLSCKRMAGQQRKTTNRKTTSRKTTGGGRSWPKDDIQRFPHPKPDFTNLRAPTQVAKSNGVVHILVFSRARLQTPSSWPRFPWLSNVGLYPTEYHFLSSATPQ